MHATIFYLHGTALEVDMKISNIDELHFRLVLDGCPTKSRTDSRQQFICAEWFGYIIVRPGIEGLLLDAFFTSHREHNDWYLRIGSYVSAQFQAVHVRHAKIGYQQVRRPALHHLDRLVTIRRGA